MNGADAFGRTGCKVNHCWQNTVIDNNFFSGIFGLLKRISNHHGHMVAHVAHLALGKCRVGTGFHGRTVFGMDHPAADQTTNLVRCNILSRVNCEYAWHFQSSRVIHFFQGGMGMGRAHEEGIGLAGAVYVVCVIALTCYITVVFLAAHRCANASGWYGSNFCCGHWGFLSPEILTD